MTARARRRRHPEVGRARVEVNEERRWGSPNRHVPRPLLVAVEVCQVHLLPLVLAGIEVGVRESTGKHHGRRNGGHSFGQAAGVTVEVEQVVAMFAT